MEVKHQGRIKLFTGTVAGNGKLSSREIMPDTYFQKRKKQFAGRGNKDGFLSIPPQIKLFSCRHI